MEVWTKEDDKQIMSSNSSKKILLLLVLSLALLLHLLEQPRLARSQRIDTRYLFFSSRFLPLCYPFVQ